ncbi:MAG: DUF3187 family protein [Gammaproteobacteria bacterium]
MRNTRGDSLRPRGSRVVHHLMGCVLSAALLAQPAWAQVAAPPGEGAEPVTHYGLLRTRDLTPFGFLRLDMRPAHAVASPPGNWAVEADFGYQNTWVLSKNVKTYLNTLPGRRGLGPDEVQAIRDLPGEAFLVDLELGLLDITFHRKFTERWGAFATVNGVMYTGGFLDGGIEWFHRSLDFPDAARPRAGRNDIHVIFDLKGSQTTLASLPDGGLLDPIFGARYTAAPGRAPWNYVIEWAVKVPFDGEREFLSTGHFDFGVQATAQRFMHRHAAYASLAVVHSRSNSVAPATEEFIPTAILGYEYALNGHTNLNAQLYMSPSVFTSSDTGLDELRDNKYQISFGLRHRIGPSLITVGVTENLVYFNNSPDFGFQMAWIYSPVFAR